MSDDITDEDVTAGAVGLLRFMPWVESDARVAAAAVLAAVLPAYTRRKRLEWERDEACGGLPLIEHDRELSKRVRAEALREAVPPLARFMANTENVAITEVARWLLHRADAEEGK
jgi:hypothetical protein